MEKGCDKRLWNKERGDEQTAVLKSPNKAEHTYIAQEFNRQGAGDGDRTNLYTLHDDDSAALCSIILLCQTYANAGGAGGRTDGEDECACVMAEANVEFPHTHTQ